jgi:GIY-YIG catalytic domain.
MSDFKVGRMLLYPQQWKKYVSPIGHPLSWNPVKFKQGNASDVPNTFGGVYSFVVRPEIAEHPQCAYIMYIGKANNFRKRYYKYQSYDRGEVWEADQPHVAEMIHKWSEYLWFYYAKISDVSMIRTTEISLIQAFIPPVNREIGGKLGMAVNTIFG